MIRNIIKYGGLALVIIGIVLVMKNLFNPDSAINSDNKKENTTKVSTSYYSVAVSLLDEETKSFISGGNLIIRDKDGSVISGWTSGEGVHLVPNLKKGIYTLVEEQAPEGYKLNSDGITFEIKNKDKELILYNSKMTEEEKRAYEAEQREKNTITSEIDVANTSSTKGFLATLLAIISVALGIKLISKQKDNFN